MNSPNFNFLRNFHNDLHYLASVIEDEIYTSPSAVLTDATTFLEIIVYEIFKKYDLSTESLPYFNDKITALYEGKFISKELKSNMQKAYQKRNKMHSYDGDIKNHLNLNKNRAIQIHKLIFNVSWLYYNQYCDDSFKMPKPSYTHPSKFKNNILTENKIESKKCIICGNNTKSDDETFCSDCRYKIEKSDNLKTLKKHFGFKKGFKRSQLIEMGFEKGYAGPLLQELKNEELIYTINTLNKIDKEKTNKYIQEAEDMIAVEKVLSEFKLRNIDLNDISNHEFYLKGRNNQYPFVELYNIFNEIFHSNFLKNLNSEDTFEQVLNKSYLNEEELKNWYLNEMKNNTSDFTLFNEKLINEIFKYKKSGLTIEEIKEKINIPNTIFDTINDNAEIKKLYKQKKDEHIFSLFINEIRKEYITKKEALNKVGLTQKQLDELLLNNFEFQEKYEKSYTKSRMNRFIKFFDYYNYKSALKKVGLTITEINDWLTKGKNTIKFDEKNIFSRFLIDFNNTTMKKYIEYREKNNTRKKSFKKLNTDSEHIIQLLNKNEEYKKQLDTVLINQAIEEFKLGKTKNEVIKKLDLNTEWLNTALQKGQANEELFKELYNQYSNNAIPLQIDEFLKLIKNKPLKNVISQLNMDETEMNSWYEKGKNDEELFTKFYNEFFQFKKEKYIKVLIKTDSKKKAIKKSYLTPDELLEHEEEFNKIIFDKKISIVMKELKKGKTSKKACNKASIKIKDMYAWLNEGMNGNEEYGEFVKVFKEEYLTPIRKSYSEGIKKGFIEKNIIKIMKKNDFLVDDDIKYLKQLNLFPKPEDTVVELEEHLDMNLKESSG